MGFGSLGFWSAAFVGVESFQRLQSYLDEESLYERTRIQIYIR